MSRIRSRILQRLTDAITMIKLPEVAASRSSALFCILFILVGALLCTRIHLDTSLSLSTAVLGTSTRTGDQIQNKKPVLSSSSEIPKTPRSKIDIPPLNCTDFKLTRICPTNTGNSSQLPDPVGPGPAPSSSGTCPEYVRWIHEDLRPWAHTGITREMVEGAKRTANFRLVIVDGKAYLDRYGKSFQSRDTFTVWGILQLLRRYPGQVPDLELMFDCVDWPVIKKSTFVNTSTSSAPNATSPPPLFRYCGDDESLDIVFPDWSFWGWPEINIKPWDGLLKDIKEGNKKRRWEEREAYAYWKGNPAVAATRQDLLKCNLSEKHDWNARLYAQDWIQESRQGYKQSDLANQCIHRYKVYIEGSAWSVSEKYILACDSVSLVVKPHYYDFFTRGLVPIKHYWPIKEDDKCRSIKFAVDWGNTHQNEAMAMGKAGSGFIEEELKMEKVYDYMFHLLNEYAKLLTFKPIVPQKAIELCPETMVCAAKGLEHKFMMESLVRVPSETSPCIIPPPYDPPSLYRTSAGNRDSIKQVELWEKEYWDSQNH